MTFTVPRDTAIEFVGSRRGRASADGSAEMTLIYKVPVSSIVSDPYTHVEAIADLVDAAAPATIVDPWTEETLYREDVEYEPEGDASIYLVNLNYVTADRRDQREHSRPDTGEYTWTLSTTGGTARITATDDGTVTKYPATATDHNGLIGIDQDGNAQGVDIIVPASRWTLTFRHPAATITNAYRLIVENLTGRSNDDTFFGAAAGEVLFAGGDGRSSIQADPVWTFNFIRGPNRTGLKFGSITGVAKKAHEYLWVEFKPGAKDTNSKRTKMEPIGVYVHTVYPEGDFSTLGVGTS